MNIEEILNLMDKGGADNLKLDNDDAIKFLQAVIKKAMLAKFKITINHRPGNTLFQKVT